MGYHLPLNAVLAVHRFTITGDPEEMLVMIGIDAGEVAPFDVTNANQVQTAFTGSMMQSFPPTVSFLGVTCYVGQDAADPIVVESTGATLPGTGSGTSLPPQCAYLVKKATNFGGRSGRGRMFLPGPNEGNISPAGVLDPAQITQVQGDVNDWLTALSTLDMPMLLLHAEESVVNTPFLVTSLVVDSKVATQRRRLR